MARPLRIEYPGALYHVTSRGNGKRLIFLNDQDRRVWLELLEETVKAHRFIVHAYCLMGNHFHLLIETPEGNLARGMHYLNAAYTQWFNKVHGRVGHVLQGRYKAFVIEKDSYFLEVARYIVLNPVRAGVVRSPGQWPWSNYRATVGKAATPDFLCIKDTLRYFDRDMAKACQSYSSFVRDRLRQESPFRDAKHRCILGSPQFVHEIWEKTKGKEIEKEFVRESRFVGRPTLKSLFRGIHEKSLRDDMIRFARYRCGYSLIDIAKVTKLSYSFVGKIAKSAKV